MPRTLILYASVDCGIPSFAAAPDGPETLPLLSASAASIVSRSLRESPLKAAAASARNGGGEASLESHNSSTDRTSQELRITDLSITFGNSRMLPGHS